MLLRIVIALVAVFAASQATAQEYPAKPIRLVTAEPGGSSDFAARLLALWLPKSMGQPAIVENRGSALAPETVSKAAPDGYAVLVTGGSFWVSPLIRETNYDVVKEFAPVAMIATGPLLVVVHPSLPAKGIKDLIVLAKARPGELNYSSGSIGAATQLAPELFKAMAQVNIVHVPYRGSGPAVIGLLSGAVQVMFDTGASLIPHVKSGKLRAIAVTSTQPSVLFPGLPTVAATVPGYEYVGPTALFAPAKTPAAIVSRLNREVMAFLAQPDVKEKFLTAGLDNTAGSSPEQLGASVKSDMTRLGKVIKDAGIRN